jgi:hypothetical protein
MAMAIIICGATTHVVFMGVAIEVIIAIAFAGADFGSVVLKLTCHACDDIHEFAPNSSDHAWMRD